MAVVQRERCTGRTRADRWARRAPEGFAQGLDSRRLAFYVFAFHAREELGPKMLARIAEHTGLTPVDVLPNSRVQQTPSRSLGRRS